MDNKTLPNEQLLHKLRTLRMTLTAAYKNLTGPEPDQKEAFEIFNSGLTKLDEIILSISQKN